nr:hypothetical protein [Flaviflexus salsibiostraticola]
MTEVSDDKYQAVQDSRPSADVALARDVREIFDHMLGDGRSVIDPSATIWTAEAGAELRARVGDDPIHGKSMGQWDKLDIQLSGAKRETVLLAAELVFLREYVLSNSRPETRLTNLKQVLANLDSPVTIPDKMLDWTARPAGRAGLKGSQGYYGGLWLHLTWAATFMIHWNSGVGAGPFPGTWTKWRSTSWIRARYCGSSFRRRSASRQLKSVRQ